MNYIIWNKIDKINGFDASFIIKEYGIKETDGVFLIGTDLNNIERIEIDTIIKINEKLDMSLSTEEVAQAYVAKTLEQEQKMENDKNTIEMQAEKIEVLEKENSDLLLDSIEKDNKLEKLDKDLAELTLEIVGGN